MRATGVPSPDGDTAFDVDPELERAADAAAAGIGSSFGPIRIATRDDG